MAQKEMRKMMQGAVVLTIASFIAKLLSAIYRVPFQNAVGDEGFYVYQQVYPIYGIAMTLALSGLPQFISKYIVEKETPREQKEALKQLYPLVFWCAISLWALCFFGSGLLAKIMGDAALAPLIQVVSFTFLLVPGLSFYRGNFQGHLLMVPTAASQVLEQLIRVGIILSAATAYLQLGLTVYQTGMIAMSGAFFGGVCGFLLLTYYEKKIHGGALRLRSFPVKQRPKKELIRRFLIEGGLLSIYSGYLIFFQLADSFLITNGLELHGLTEQAARVAKGVYDRGQPLVQLGLVVATALSATFLPALTRSLVQTKKKQFQQSARIYLRLTVSLAMAASVGLALLLPYFNYALFKDTSGTKALTVFVFAIGLMATIQAYQSIAQSQNWFRMPLKAAGWGLLVKALSTIILTTIVGTLGASLATLCGLAMTLAYLVQHSEKELNGFWKERRFGRTFLLCLIAMAVSLLLYNGAVIGLLGPLHHRMTALFISIIGVIIGASCFIFVAIRLKLFTVREWLMIPFGKKLLKIKLNKKEG
ncbi:polysaccharide biosynthesis protein [Enterococcus sp. JM4C]|uniref:putative polysaccharide biosynthesis protein n=1 Tax=Candidatus Enterococcus huntleyi TaxID=1857217 RepID=UPI00137A2913|nr:polysaccharide biosynthesis protein [Enterococcus sp. JM4C]KAF1295260.1 polysaccharide biosynthesis protein [Enterococcus sp. JM4C]